MKKQSLAQLLLLLAISALAKTNTVNFDVFRPQAMTEFAGGDSRAPLDRLSVNSILGYCAEVNKYFQEDPCDGPGYAHVLTAPSSVILAPSENDRNGASDLLIAAESYGALFYFDGNPAHRKSAAGFTLAEFGKANLDFGTGAALENIVSDNRGGFWVADPGRRRVLRIAHTWSGSHSFAIVGELVLDRNQLEDIYFTDMKTGGTEDDRLYVATSRPSRILVVDPYFTSRVLESELVETRDLNVSLGGLVNVPQSLFGAYNNEPGSVADPRDIYIVHDDRRLTLIRDYGVEATLRTEASVASNVSSRVNCIRSNAKGELYLIDAGKTPSSTSIPPAWTSSSQPAGSWLMSAFRASPS